ncbi:hypothetical protein E2562_006179, partial [Oryza meyeriana var. granulata]
MTRKRSGAAGWRGWTRRLSGRAVATYGIDTGFSPLRRLTEHRSGGEQRQREEGDDLTGRAYRSGNGGETSKKPKTSAGKPKPKGRSKPPTGAAFES